MEQYTRLNKKEIEEILAVYNIQDILSFALLTGGLENTNYLVVCETNKYVVSVCEQKTLETANLLTTLLQHLNRQKFNTSIIVETPDSKSVTTWNAKPIIVKEFIAGKIKRMHSPDLLELIGIEIAKLHKINAPDYLQKELSNGEEQFGNVRDYAPDSDFANWLDGILDYILPFTKLNLPKSLIHSDVCWNNVIISENEDTVIIMDFEEAAYYYRVFDIGMAIIGLCGEEKIINIEKAKHIIKGYQQEIKLLDEEIDSLKAFTIYAGATMTYWRHQNFNHIKPDPKMFDHYKELKYLVDFVFGQADDCFN